MIIFLNINASGLTLIPVTILMFRAQFGAANPSDVFLPILIATFFSTLVTVIFVCLVQKINLFQRSLIFFFGGLAVFIGSLIWFFHALPAEKVTHYLYLIAFFFLFTIICSFIFAGIYKNLNIFDTFISGEKEDFLTVVKIIPYLIVIFVAIGVFRASGAMGFLIDGMCWFVTFCGFDASFVEVLLTIFRKPLSGSAARGMMSDAMRTYGANSFVGRLSCVAQGSTDTILYVVAVYYGSIGIWNTRHTIPCALLADLGGAVAAILVSYLFSSNLTLFVPVKKNGNGFLQVVYTQNEKECERAQDL
jgi:spore maturation protein SpmB